MSSFNGKLVTMQKNLIRTTILISGQTNELVKLNAKLAKYIDKIEEKETQANSLKTEIKKQKIESNKNDSEIKEMKMDITISKSQLEEVIDESGEKRKRSS